MRIESLIWKDKEGRTNTLDRIRTSIEAYKFIKRFRKSIKNNMARNPYGKAIEIVKKALRGFDYVMNNRPIYSPIYITTLS
ncbi:MAG: hypothetical protein HY578_08530 [Nitrospinae bacterium]|nr:hypothetical protein [Nitrospinota bacterium]